MDIAKLLKIIISTYFLIFIHKNKCTLQLILLNELTMNYLAHLFLSGNDDSIKIGNFIADGIKGNKYQLYPITIQKGILLHRQIDWFTDNNEIVKQSKKRLNKRYGHFKGIIIDILYDHYLAKNWITYADIPLQKFTHSFYDCLGDNYNLLPEKIQFMMSFMIKEDWITNYANLEGIENVLIGMNRRTKGKGQMNLAIEDLNNNYEEFENDFTLFFNQLIDFSNLTLHEINNKLT